MQQSPNKIFSVIGICGLVLQLMACQSAGDSTRPEAVAITNISREVPYAVGSTTVFIHDESRPFDAVAGVNFGVRTLITEIWYPVTPADITADSVRATFGDYVFGNREMHRRMMTQTTFFHLTPQSVREGVTQATINEAIDELFTRPRGSFIDAPVATGPKAWPVIMMTHGDAGSRYNMQTVCEYLASHGYIVMAPDHTGNSPYSMIGMDPALDPDNGDAMLRHKMANVLPLLDEHGAYGEEESYGQSYTPLGEGFNLEGLVDLDLSLVERVNDLRVAMSTLDEMNQQGPFSGHIDMSSVGLMGRSFGGATTLSGLIIEDRFTAGFVVVPPSLPDARAIMPEAMLVHPPQESAILATKSSFGLGNLHKPTLLLSGGEDHLILGLAHQSAAAIGSALPTIDTPYPVLKHAFDTTSVPAIMARVQNTNHDSFGVSGPYWWPLLKPDTYPKFFDTSSQYTLLDSEIAHRVQREMALAFFALTVRGDMSSLEVLRRNPWQHYETSIEIRGF